jgi:SAM-dependent methyltransferase
MEPLIKIDIHKLIKENKPVIIDIGCGPKKKEGHIGIDRVDMPQVDIVTDIESGLPFFPDQSVDEIHCRSVLEHINNFEPLLTEMIRVLKNEGKAYIFVPHFSNPYYYSDPTHIRPFGLYTFYYFADRKHQIRRKVPNFYSPLRLQILSQRLIFRSKFGMLGFLKKTFERLVNCCTLFQEYYEENLVYKIPAHGIEFIIGRSSGKK